MAALTDRQTEVIEQVRNAGHDQPANMLEGLFAQIQERPDDAQLTEMISNMLRQYLDGYEPKSFHLADTVGNFVMPLAEGKPGQWLLGGKFVDPPQCSMFDECTLGDGHLGPHNSGGEPIEPGAFSVQVPTEESKPPLHLVPFGFIIEMAKVMQEGIRGDRKAHGWEQLNDAELEERRGALLRHYGEDEWASVATNAAILWWHDKNGSR